MNDEKQEAEEQAFPASKKKRKGRSLKKHRKNKNKGSQSVDAA